MKNKLFIILAAVVAVAVLLGGGGAYWYWTHQRKSTEASAEKPHEKLFISLKPMVVKLQSKGHFGLPSGGATYLQVGFEFASDQKTALAAFKKLRPAIRGNVLDMVLGASPKILHDSSARRKISHKALEVVNRTLVRNNDKLGEHAFKQVYITRFVTQPG